MPELINIKERILINWGRLHWSTIHPNADVTLDVEDYRIKFGSSLGRETTFPSLLSASGRVVLNNATGKYSRGNIDSIDSLALGKRSAMRIQRQLTPTWVTPDDIGDPVRTTTATVDSDGWYTVWQGCVQPPDTTEDTANLVIEGGLIQRLTDKINVFHGDETTLETLVSDQTGVDVFGLAQSPENVPSFGFGDVPTGVVSYRGPWAGYINALGHWSGCYPFESHLGELGLFDRHQALGKFTSYGILDGIDDPLVSDTEVVQAVDQIVNEIIDTTRVSYVAPNQRIDQLFGISIPAGEQRLIIIQPDDENVISVTWDDVANTDISGAFDPDTTTFDPTEITVAQSSSRRSVSFVLTNNSSMPMVDISFEVRGTPLRASLSQTVELTDQDSQDRFGRIEGEVPPWWNQDNIARAGEWAVAQKGLENIVRFSALRYQPTTALSALVETIQPGFLTDLNINYRGVVLNQKAMVMSVELESRQGKVPIKNIELLTIPSSTDQTKWILGISRLGIDTILGA